jgi:hypothetical protein
MRRAWPVAAPSGGARPRRAAQGEIRHRASWWGGATRHAVVVRPLPTSRTPRDPLVRVAVR